MLCKDCREQDEKREADLLKLLRQPDTWKRTCKKIPAGERAYSAINQNMGHKQKCLLSPNRHGEQRWDGKNKGVKREDLIFLYRRKSKW